ncbi:hypothetical protein F5883DRAFT_686293 [Diaporthe sp. PMI_573]|nr:hypothetical protein F5883DRAFT_686293 [Diaporthaceae sp. PMI_573]
MSIVVLPNKVERLASLLFNAPLETNGNVRELILPDGLCVIPKQLQGSPPEAVTGVFGPTVAAALESAPYRKIEVSEAGPRVATRCVVSPTPTIRDNSNLYSGSVLELIVSSFVWSSRNVFVTVATLSSWVLAMAAASPALRMRKSASETLPS